MRTTLIDSIIHLATINENVWFLTGDLGYSFVEKFEKKFPDRFVNVGVAEQNMLSIAAGLALQGKKVFVYSIINFCTFRCLEQIRNDVCYHNLDVTIIGVGTGYSYSDSGYSHHGIEDIGIMKMLPNLKIYSPADITECKSTLNYIAKTPGPFYVRIDKSSSKKLHMENYISEINLPIKIKKGEDASLLSFGSTIEMTLDVAKKLDIQGVYTAVYSLPKIFPLKMEDIEPLAKRKGLFVIEEHIHSGLGGIISDLLMQSVFRPIFEIFCLKSIPVEYAGSQEELRKAQGLDVEAILKKICSRMLQNTEVK